MNWGNYAYKFAGDKMSTENGNHQTVNEMAAVSVNTTPEDDSLALKFSPLEVANGRIKQKHDLWYWYALFVPLNLIAAFNAMIWASYRMLLWLLWRLKRCRAY